MTTPQPTPQVYTVSEVAKILKVHLHTVYHALDAGQLRGFRIGAAWRISQEALEAFMQGERETK